VQIQAHAFRPRDLVAGHVALDLVNTVTARNADPIDWLDSYPRLLDWAELTGEFDRSALQALRSASSVHPAAAARALRRAKRLRETLHDILVPVTKGKAPGAALDQLDRLWKDAVRHAQLSVVDGQARPQLRVDTSALDYLSHELALRAADLLRALPLSRTRVCAGPRCGWLFIDTSKGGRRRWCDMATCGNAAKTIRHRKRLRR
jgi:predicted RNA-binding Zn ribbon-like protein